MKRVLSCIQPTGNMHLGNYFGAIKNWVEMQENYEAIYGIVDMHAITVPYEPKVLREKSRQMFLDIMACGIDPQKAILFIQSYVPEHTELAWIFNCLTPYGELTRQTQFKDKSQQQTDESKSGFISTGLLTYPILQAADILIYRANYVPVGKDQKQHLELSRNTAERFNHRFGEYFPVPEHKFTEIPKVLSLADPSKKMSKSLGEKHYVALFEEEKSIRKKINRAVTDSGETTEGEMSPGVFNLFQLLKACGKEAIHKALMQDYESGNLQYGKLKGEVGDAIVELTKGFKARRKELEMSEEALEKMIVEMSDKARAIASETVREVRKLMGLR